MTRFKLHYAAYDHLAYILEMSKATGPERFKFIAKQALLWAGYIWLVYLHFEIVYWVRMGRGGPEHHKYHAYHFPYRMFLDCNQNVYFTGAMSMQILAPLIIIRFMTFGIPKMLGEHLDDIHAFINEFRKLSVRQAMSFDTSGFRMKTYPFLSRRHIEKLFILGTVSNMLSMISTFGLMVFPPITPIIYFNRDTNYESPFHFILFVINLNIWAFLIYNICRLCCFVVQYHLVFSMILSMPITEFSKKFTRRYRRYGALKLASKIQNLKNLYIHSLIEYMKFDSGAVAVFFTHLSIVTLPSNVVILACLLTDSFAPDQLLWCRLLIGIHVTLFGIVIYQLIRTSKTLTMCSRSVIAGNASFAFSTPKLPVSQRYTCSMLAEMMYAKKQFRFSFGSLGRISWRALFTFVIFYSAWILTFVSDFTSRSNH